MKSLAFIWIFSLSGLLANHLPHEHWRKRHQTMMQHETTTDNRENPSNCPACANNQQLLANFTKERIRHDILQKLGMTEAPKVSKEDLPEHLLEQIMFKVHHQEFEEEAQKKPSEENSEENFKVQMINVMAKNASGILSPKVMEIGNAIQYFDLNIHQLRHLTANDIISAKLHLHLAKAKNPLDLDVWIDTFLIQMDEYGQVVSNRIRTTKTTILPDFGGWVEINVEVAVSQWMKNPFNNMGLDFKITTGLNDTIAFGVDQEEVPYLQIGVQDTWNDRNRRATPKLCSENPQGCCMEPLQVNFSRDFNWTWIIHPLTVDTFYCSGDCALGASAPDNNYVHLLQQKGLTPCCGVRKSKDLSIVYHHQDHQEQNDIIIQGKLDGLIVTDCGCS